MYVLIYKCDKYNQGKSERTFTKYTCLYYNAIYVLLIFLMY